MPLTGAEKTRRYREKLKKNRPEEYKAQCKRNLQRMKNRKKKISEMSPSEAEHQRQKWREEKRRSYKQKKEKRNEQTKSIEDTEPSVPVPPVPADGRIIKNLRIKCKILTRKCRNLSIQVQKLKTQKEAYKKRYHRLKQSTTKKITDLENARQKQQAREEVLEYTLKTTYQQTKTHKEKKILRKIIQNTSNKTYVRKMMGLKGKGRNNNNKIKRIEIAEITNFYLRDDVSRNTAGKKQTKTRNKNKLQIRYLTDSLVNLYKKYKGEGGRYGFTTFYKQKPFYVISPHLNARDTCLCVKHSNLEFQHISLKKHGLFKNGVRELLNQISCDTGNYACMYRNCKDCKDRKPFYSRSGNNEEDNINVSWLQWERQDHTYSKRVGNKTIEITTKKTAKVLKTGSLETLKKDFEKDLQAFKKHHFNMQRQQKQYQIAISQLKDNEVIIVCDFSENYEAKLGSEIQAMHFGASKNQITLHTGMIYWVNRSQSFCTIAELNNHQPPAIWAHLTPLLDLIKKESPNVTVIHFFSDGPSSQYRQKNNFYLLAHFMNYHRFDYATWSYFESGHGKSVADGIGGCVKRTLDAKVCQGIDVVDAKNAYEILSQCLKRIKVFLIPDSTINEIGKILPSNVQALKGTLSVHQIITRDKHSIKFRDVSCFCGPLPGHCDCFSPQIHHVVSCNVNTRPQKIKRESVPCSDTIIFNPPHRDVPSILKENLNPVSSGVFEISDTDLEPPTKKSNTNSLTNLLSGYDKEPEINTENPKRLQNINDICCSDISNFIPYKIEDSVSTTFEVNLGPSISDQAVEMSNTDLEPPFLQQIESISISDLKNLDNDIGFDNFDLAAHSVDTLPMTFISPTGTINISHKTEAIISQNVASRNPKFLECHKCKTLCSTSCKKARCMVCKRWYCEKCVDGTPMELDYICDECFLQDSD